MLLEPGARLGRYIVEAPVGAGGMGEVYRGRDTRLDRPVAIKVLAAGAAADPAGGQRFEREARTLASLSHAHICPIYDVGRDEARAVDYLVMELLEGETLARRIARGPLPLDEALRLGAAIADALAAAHAHGIVHRDLKPGNVMLTASGVKLVDFGIARAAATPAAATAAAVTQDGQIIGTLEYMAPEQRQGLPVDGRADLFALGAVLHEMVTGQSRLTAASPRAALPAALERLIARCLAERLEDRWSSAHDAALLLRDMAEGRLPAAPAASAPSASRLPWAVAALALLAALALAAASYLTPPAEPPLRRLAVPPPPDASFALEEAPQISPDGTRLLFVGRDREGATRLYLRPLDSAAAQAVAGTETATQPFWAPDSIGFGFFADGWLRVVESTGAAPRTVARATTPRGASWGRNGRILYLPFPAGPLFVVPIGGGEPARLTSDTPRPHDYRWFPQWLPSGDRYLGMGYSQGRGGGTVSIGGPGHDAMAPLAAGASHAVYAEPGYILFRREQGLAALPFDAEAGRPTADARELLADVMVNPITNQAAFSVSQTGVLAYVESTQATQLTRYDRGGAALEDASVPGQFNSLCAAPGGRIVVDGTDERGISMDLYTTARGGGALTRLTFDTAVDFFPVCSDDGSEVVFASLRGGPPDLYRMAVSAPGTERLILDTPLAKLPTDWSADGRLILFTTIGANTSWDIWALPLGGAPPYAVVTGEAQEREAVLSRDGRWIAYASNESGQYEVWLQPFPPTGARWQVSRSGGVQPRWRGDGRELFYLSGDRALAAVEVNVTGQTPEFGTARTLFRPRVAALEPYTAITQYAVAPRGDVFLVNRLSEAALARSVSVILNWPALLRR